ncbi:hypothetical protein [Rhodobium gokarnense]|uniref:Nucleotide-diphospho-sugar transferase domain-containing protein n=1 Tax=Rhodobium gokarnense TaxID=364296 RepID=A0ABT3HH45_9HYPH|nr:hypothetical protein [Rhodobium gokarnense]MCW2309732.1 hypothetical protein [Rhodobium gokarnense]
MIVTFATTDPHYASFADRFEARMDELGLAYHIERVSPFPTPRQACLAAPAWIKRQVRRFGPVTWIDVDTEVLQAPEIDLGEYDVGFAENPERWRRRCPENAIASAVLAFNDTPGARRFLSDWQRLCEQWKPGEYGAHRRLCFVREYAEVRELDITPLLRGKIVYRGAKGAVEVAA